MLHSAATRTSCGVQNPRKLEIYDLALELAVNTYRLTRDFPQDERFGMTSQLRRAAVSVGCNIAEGCGRPGLREYLNFLGIAMGSASELTFLFDLGERLEFGDPACLEQVRNDHDHLRRKTIALITSLRSRRDRQP